MRRIALMFGVAIGLVLMAASGASAAPSGQVTPIGFSFYTKDIHGHVGSQALHEAATGLIVVSNSDGTHAFAYCIDVGVTIILNKQFTPQTWDSSHTKVSADDLARINWILHQYPADATAAKGTTNGAIEAAGVQSAIWFFSDNFTFTSADRSSSSGNDPAVIALYDQIVAAAKSHTMAQPAPSLSISPSTATATAGSQTGPYTVTTTATAPVTLAVTPAGSADIINCTTHAAVSSVSNGGSFCLSRATAGSTTVTGTATAPLPVGTVLVDLAENNQQLIQASELPVSTTASTAGHWTAAPTPPTVTMACPTGGFQAGQPATFTATPSGGTGPFTFEWAKNGTVIPGATGSSVTVTLAATDTLSVKATDTATGLTSAAATAACTGTTPHPAITITKVANPTSVFGPANVTFTYVITNAGNVPLKLASLVDDHGTPGKAGDDLPIADFKNCNTSAVMLPGASITCTIGYALPQVTAVTSQTNTVVVVGTPVTPSGTPTGQPNVTDTAQATVVNNPAQVLAQQVPNTPESPAAPAATPTTTAAPSTLPRTGTSSTAPLVATGLLLVLAGLGVEAGRRRRRKPTA